jgi:hypothetical protein
LKYQSAKDHNTIWKTDWSNFLIAKLLSPSLLTVRDRRSVEDNIKREDALGGYSMDDGRKEDKIQ